MPVQLTFRDFPPSPAITTHVMRRADKLDTFHTRLVGVHVVVEAPHLRKRHGSRFRVRVDMRIPGKELVASHGNDDDKEDLHGLIERVFDEAERLLEADTKRRQPDQKAHRGLLHGIVRRIFPERGYGFVRADDGHEVYFHQNAVLGAKFDRLAEGTPVKFAEEDGDDGPQASTLHVAPARIRAHARRTQLASTG